MTDTIIAGTKVFYENGHHCGDLEYDEQWKQWRFKPLPDHTYSPEWLIDIGKTIQWRMG